MRISFLGAAEMVTGSCYLLEVENIKFLVDCGLFQGGREADDLNFREFDFNPAEIDYLILTHAHIDHSGRIPLLVKGGFRGKIITTIPTARLCNIMLPDSAYIQEMENEWVNRKRARAGKPPVEPLYTVQDAMNSLNYFSPVDYNEIITPASCISVRFRDAGHILGSAITEIWIRDNGDEFKIVFSGDLGNKNVPLMKSPTIIEDADYLVLESTYGNRLHKNIKGKALLLLDIIMDAVERGGNVVIPSFAIERTQEILFELNQLKESETVKIKDIPVYVDSPLAIRATKIFQENIKYLNEETQLLFAEGDDPFNFPNLHFTATPEESREINTNTTSKIIISASGMCEAGRIKHHLKHNLWRPECSIVFVGYQAKETLGRRIIDGERNVKIFGEDIHIQSNIYSLEGFSGHADQSGLLDWVSQFKKKPKKIFLTHGEDEALTELSRLIRERFHIEYEIPKREQVMELTSHSVGTIPRVETRYRQQKTNVIKNIHTIKGEFNNTLAKLQAFVNENEDIQVDKLLHLLEKIESAVGDMNKELK